MRVLAALLLLLTLFYVMTGLVYQEGSFAGALVIKPYPMLQPAFGGGEEGAWARHHPSGDRPWFMRHDYVELWRFDWEYGVPFFVTAYLAAYLVTPVGWVVLGVVWLVRRRRVTAT